MKTTKSSGIQRRFQRKLQPIHNDKEQLHLNDRDLEPYMQKIFEDFQTLRQVIDQEVCETLKSRLTKPLLYESIVADQIYDEMLNHDRLSQIIESYLKRYHENQLIKYPIALCQVITGIAFDYLNEPITLEEFPGFVRLKKFISKGGVFRKIWGKIDERYFQTALQIGSYYMDVANNTVELNKPPVCYSLLKDSGYATIDDLETYVSIAKSYLNADAFLNTCFPNLSPFFPLFFRSDTGFLHLGLEHSMVELALETNLETSRSFIQKGGKGTVPFPSEGTQLLNSLVRNITAPEALQFFSHYQEENLSELERIFVRYQQMSDEVLHGHFLKACQVAKIINRFLDVKRSPGEQGFGKSIAASIFHF